MQNDRTETYDPVDPKDVEKLLKDGEHIVEVGQTVDVDGVPHKIRAINDKDLVLRPAHWDQLDRFDDVDVHELQSLGVLEEGKLEASQNLTLYMKLGERFRAHNVIFKVDRVRRQGIWLKPEVRCTIIEGSPV